jgi:hypothetical protein
MMAVPRNVEAEEGSQARLERGRRREISSAYDARDGIGFIVDHGSEMIGVRAVSATHEWVTEESQRIPRKIEAALVSHLDASVIETQAKR